MAAAMPEGSQPVREVSVQRQTSRSVEEEELVPTTFEKFLHNRPCCAWFTFLGSSLFVVAMAVAMFQAGVVEVTTDSVWDVRGDVLVKRWDGFVEARDDGDGGEFIGDEPTPERSEGGSTITIAYEVKDGNVFDSAIMEKIMEFEKVIMSDAEWPNHCQLIYDPERNASRCIGGTTVLTHWRPGVSLQAADIQDGFGPCNGNGEQADQCVDEAFAGLEVGKRPCTSRVYNPGTAEMTPSIDPDYKDTFRCMCCAAGEAGCDDLSCDNVETDFCGLSVRESRTDFRNKHIAKDFSCSSGTAKLLRSFYALGFPRDGYTSTHDDDDMDEMREKVEEWTTGDLFTALFDKREELIDDNFEIYIFGAGIDQAFFTTTLTSDQFLAIGSIAIVFVWIWAGTSSFFLACCGMTEIILSLPLAMFAWGALQGKFISFFMLTIVFLILGIGADDIFVLWDAVQQSYGMFQGDEGASLKQFAWALRRARNAMTVTSSTTFCALILAGTSSIPSLSAFGIFGSLVVLFDFILVITFFPAGVIIYNNRFKGCQGPCNFLQRKCGAMLKSGEADLADAHLRPPEKFFRDTYSPLVNRFRYPIAIVWLLIGIAGAIVPSIGLRPSEESPAFFNDDYGKRFIDLLSGDDFPKANDEAKVPVYIVMGLDPDEAIDRAGTNYQDTEEIGEPQYKPPTNLLKPSGQKTLWDLCEKARSGDLKRLLKDEGCQGELTPVAEWGGVHVRIEDGACQTGAVCFIDWVHDFRISYRNKTEENWHEDEELDVTLNSAAFSPGGQDHPVPAAFASACGECCNVMGWYMCMMSFVRTSTGMQKWQDWSDMSRFYMESGKLKWAYVGFNSSLPLENLPLSEIEPHFDDWTDFAEDNLGSVEGFQTCNMWVWMVSQREILRSVAQSISLCFLLALIILMLSTTNWIISLISFSCIVLIFFVFAMMITAFGHALGIFEAVGLIVVIGLSVDYSVHIGHSYNETRYIAGKQATRFEKMRHALTEMGISVLSGSMTTLLASMFLLPASFMFYHVFGIFMLITVIASTLVALTLLPALLCIVGPEGDRGDLLWLRKAYTWLTEKCTSCTGKGNKVLDQE